MSIQYERILYIIDTIKWTAPKEDACYDKENETCDFQWSSIPL